jgi:hypothetical protein
MVLSESDTFELRMTLLKTMILFLMGVKMIYDPYFDFLRPLHLRKISILLGMPNLIRYT